MSPEVRKFLEAVLAHIEGAPCYDICDLEVDGERVDAAERIKELLRG